MDIQLSILGELEAVQLCIRTRLFDVEHRLCHKGVGGARGDEVVGKHGCRGGGELVGSGEALQDGGAVGLHQRPQVAPGGHLKLPLCLLVPPPLPLQVVPRQGVLLPPFLVGKITESAPCLLAFLHDLPPLLTLLVRRQWDMPGPHASVLGTWHGPSNGFGEEVHLDDEVEQGVLERCGQLLLQVPHPHVPLLPDVQTQGHGVGGRKVQRYLSDVRQLGEVIGEASGGRGMTRGCDHSGFRDKHLPVLGEKARTHNSHTCSRE